MPVLTTAIITYLDVTLRSRDFSDHCPNGLQVPGPAEIRTVVTGVSASAELFERAAAEGADLVLVHHGLFWNGAPLALSQAAKRRLQLLFDHDMALAAYHLPLDGHPKLGNNALIADGLGCDSKEPFGHHKGATIGATGHFAGDGITADELVERVHALTGREPLAFTAGPERIRSIGIVSGAAADHLGEAIGAGLDAFMTGEPAERVMTWAQEDGIHFLAAGHYATETFGVRALGDELAEHFGITHIFVDVPNPI